MPSGASTLSIARSDWESLSDQFGLCPLAIGKADENVGRVFDDVAVGDDMPLFIPNPAAALSPHALGRI